MSRRISGGICVIASIPLVVAVLQFTSVAGQAPADQVGAAAKAGPAPKTPWGEPDLQGIWTNVYETPLQRPARYGRHRTSSGQRPSVWTAGSREEASRTSPAPITPRSSCRTNLRGGAPR